jgi:hypothetical protein
MVDIGGFASANGRDAHGPEDASYLDARRWSAEAQEDAKRIQKALGVLVHFTMLRARVAE